MPGIDDLVRTQRLAWEVAEGAPPESAARVMCDILGQCDAYASLIDPVDGGGIAKGFAYLDPELMNVMAREFGTPETNPFLRAMPSLPSGRFHHCTELFDLSRLRLTRFHADWWLPSGVRDHAGGLSLPSPDGRVVWVVLGCLGDRDWFDTAELRYVHAACEGMARALRASAAFAHQAASAKVSDRAPDPCWLLGRRREVRIANGPAREITEMNDGLLQRRRGTLFLQCRRVEQRFHRLISEVCSGRRRHGSLCIADHKSFSYLTVETGPHYREERSALVTLRAPRPMSWTAECLRDAYDLTPREADVAMALAAGARPSEIAEALGLTVGSVRIYLKRIFAKTGTDGQGPLVSLLMSGHRAY
ncbi:helix-turn-helix transcriptional regulator [uncultured Jannaschia sp.]|uniref:helix-turn-helix transcriptional regulator n=1 Tax=uncultured Jannaschia sp. TaxID=293347 RepID=UPI00262CF3E4|nr:helix-turn-helix transcriptional regulator [uncultured Jannaschia sp.]